MPGYFKPWRRKFGVVTLVLVCQFTAAWVRSKVIQDEFTYATGATSGQIIATKDGHLLWMIFHNVRPTLLPDFPYWSNEPFQTFDKFYTDKSKTWKWRFCGFYSGTAPNPKSTIFLVSFWSIVIPLTLISVWLLLSKPRTARKPESSPAISN